MRNSLLWVGILLSALTLQAGHGHYGNPAACAAPQMVRFPGPEAFAHNREGHQGAARIRVGVNLVTVDVTVAGAPARDLGMEDFVLYDNGVVQEVTHFSRDELPLTVALVVDLSGSLGPYQRELRDASRSALGSLKAEDQVVLFGFGTYARRFSDLTRDFDQLARAIGSFKIGGNTNICDALFIAARYLRENARQRRRAIILVSDNEHNVLWGQTWDSALQEVLEAGATLYSIQIRNSIHDPTDDVRNIARSTGGDVLDVGTGLSLTRALNTSVANLRRQYTLGFSPSGVLQDGAFHRLDVKLRDTSACPKCRMAARRGYYVRIPSSGGPVYVDRQIKPGVIKVDARVYNRITVAAADLEDLKDIPFLVTATPIAKGPARWCKADLLIGASEVGFRFVDGHYIAKLYIAFFFGSQESSYLGTVWKIMDLNLKEEAYLQMQNLGIPFSEMVPEYPLLKTVVYDPQSERVGSRTIVAR